MGHYAPSSVLIVARDNFKPYIRCSAKARHLSSASIRGMPGPTVHQAAKSPNQHRWLQALICTSGAQQRSDISRLPQFVACLDLQSIRQPKPGETVPGVSRSPTHIDKTDLTAVNRHVHGWCAQTRPYRAERSYNPQEEPHRAHSNAAAHL